MAALGWLINLNFAGGAAFGPDSRITAAPSCDRTLTVQDSSSATASPNRTLTPADD